jgi:hypothetical protein
MRILHGHDYYDSALAWGQDDHILFLRESNRTLTDQQLCGTGVTYPDAVLSVKDHKNQFVNMMHCGWRNWSSFAHTASTCKVWSAGSEWNGLRITTESGSATSSQIIWTWQALEKWLVTHRMSLDTQPRRRYFLSTPQTTITEDWFGEKTSSDTVTSYMISNRITVITCDRESLHAKSAYVYRINGDNLGDMEFYKACDAFSMFQKISQWQGGVLAGSGNPMVQITDNVVKAHKHGFDKWSFRRPPADKN